MHGHLRSSKANDRDLFRHAFKHSLPKDGAGVPLRKCDLMMEMRHKLYATFDLTDMDNLTTLDKIRFHRWTILKCLFDWECHFGRNWRVFPQKAPFFVVDRLPTHQMQEVDRRY